jgi:hypothetical protein
MIERGGSGVSGCDLLVGRRTLRVGTKIYYGTDYGMNTFGKKKGLKQLPKSLFLLVEMNGIEPSTYALRTHRSPS